MSSLPGSEHGFAVKRNPVRPLRAPYAVCRTESEFAPLALKCSLRLSRVNQADPPAPPSIFSRRKSDTPNATRRRHADIDVERGREKERKAERRPLPVFRFNLRGPRTVSANARTPCGNPVAADRRRSGTGPASPHSADEGP